jgi:hypothetical protein
VARTRLASPELRPPFLPTAVLAAVYLATTILTWHRTLIGDEILYFLAPVGGAAVSTKAHAPHRLSPRIL